MRALALAVALAAAPVLAKAEGGGIRDGSHHNRPFQISLFGLVPYDPYFGVGAGLAARFAIPILNDGFIPSLNDSFEIELGGNFYSALSGIRYVVTPIVEARWTFHITSHFSAYPKVGFGWNFPIVTATLHPTPYLSAAAGILFEVTDWFYLRAEAGYPGLLLGVAFAF
jgi:hypothetical protein